MSNAVNLLIEDYEKKRELKHLDVELSTGKSLRIFYAPVLNVDQESKIYKHVDLDTGAFDSQIFLTSLIVRALNEDGTRMFRETDRKELSVKVDKNILQEIAAKMGGAIEVVDPKA